jgi:hypothetical protein
MHAYIDTYMETCTGDIHNEYIGSSTGWQHTFFAMKRSLIDLVPAGTTTENTRLVNGNAGVSPKASKTSVYTGPSTVVILADHVSFF